MPSLIQCWRDWSMKISYYSPQRMRMIGWMMMRLIMSHRSLPQSLSQFLCPSLQHADIQRLGLEPMAKQEMELRQGQANDALEGLRLALGQKALLYRSKVRDLPPDDGIGFDPGTVEECQKQ